VLHDALGGATAPQQLNRRTTEYIKERFNRKKKIRQRKENFFIIFYDSNESRHGHGATGAATVKGAGNSATVEALKDTGNNSQKRSRTERQSERRQEQLACPRTEPHTAWPQQGAAEDRQSKR